MILEVFGKKTAATPQAVVDASKRRLKLYDAAVKEASGGEDEES